MKTATTKKNVVINKWADSHKYFMAEGEYVGVVAGRSDTDGEYVISDGVMAPGGFVPDHYHKYEDQTFHILSGEVDVKIGNKHFKAGPGDSIHCPRGVSHYMINNGSEEARILSYIFPGTWAEDFFAETSRQNQTGDRNLKRIEDRFGVVYL